jgi:hypothetical protein
MKIGGQAALLLAGLAGVAAAAAYASETIT